VRREPPLVIAHRGASGYRPENTLSAFQLAVDQRADMVEMDLHLSRDDAIVIRHDEDLASLGLKREIRAADLAQIQSLDAGDGEKIPTLNEVLDRFGSEIAFNLEIKTGSDGAYPGFEAAVLRAVEGRGLLSSTLFSSFCDGVLGRLRALSSEARLAVLVSARRPAGALERARAVGAEALIPGSGSPIRLGSMLRTPRDSPCIRIRSTRSRNYAGASKLGSTDSLPITPIDSANWWALRSHDPSVRLTDRNAV
jgi:glycerophosphoryl diester phosphodiesterase